jgi:hypothetical protein
MRRFLLLNVQPDLLGGLVIVKEWGRIGSRRRMMGKRQARRARIASFSSQTCSPKSPSVERPAQCSGNSSARTSRWNEECGQSRMRVTKPCPAARGAAPERRNALRLLRPTALWSCSSSFRSHATHRRKRDIPVASRPLFDAYRNGVTIDREPPKGRPKSP